MQKITVFVVAESNISKKGRVAPLAPQVKSAPHYFAKSVPSQNILSQSSRQIGDFKAEFSVKTYHPWAIIVSVTIEIEDIFKEDALQIKGSLLEECYLMAEKQGADRDLSEEYAIYQISGYKGDPEVFVERFGDKIASLLKSERLELDEKEIEHTLAHQFKYAKDELMIVDWDGAFVFDPMGEFEQALELLELANYQLLRYRSLDLKLDESFNSVYSLVRQDERKWFRIKKVSQAFREMIRIRSQSLASFDAVERDMKVIGDWYSARVFDLISRKFRLETWRKNIKEKLESLEDMYSIVAENLGVSRGHALQSIETYAWFILQFFWFILIILEFVYFTK
jgi:hypothetical protein